MARREWNACVHYWRIFNGLFVPHTFLVRAALVQRSCIIILPSHTFIQKLLALLQLHSLKAVLILTALFANGLLLCVHAISACFTAPNSLLVAAS